MIKNIISFIAITELKYAFIFTVLGLLPLDYALKQQHAECIALLEAARDGRAPTIENQQTIISKGFPLILFINSVSMFMSESPLQDLQLHCFHPACQSQQVT